MHNRSQSSRDMLRQEAKLQEMTEEVRRREMRGATMPRGAAPLQGRSPGPNRPPGHLSPDGYRVQQRVPEEYRETPPPPPPPVNTHPLLQKTLSPDNRYQASMGEAPRGGYYPTGQADRRQYPYTGTNPWDREEKEKVGF